MTEEKKDDLNEQQTFLDEHKEVLESINDKKETGEDTDDTPPDVTDSGAQEETGQASETEADGERPTEKPSPPAAPASPKKNTKKKASRPEQHSPQHEQLLKQQALEQSEVKEVLVFFRKYAKPAAIVIGLVCVFVLVDKSLKARRYKREAAADTALLESRTTQDLERIVDNYASTPTSPMAMMELARRQFNSGQVDEAEELYRQFTSKHAGHELAQQAELNLITCKEAKGQFGEAHLLYGQFVQNNADSFLVPPASLGQARCLEALDQLDEAQIAYEDIMVNFPGTTWSQIAEANLKSVLSRK